MRPEVKASLEKHLHLPEYKGIYDGELLLEDCVGSIKRLMEIKGVTNEDMAKKLQVTTYHWERVLADGCMTIRMLGSVVSLLEAKITIQLR